MAISDARLLVLATLLALGCATGTSSVRALGSQPLALRAADQSRLNLRQLWSTHQATVLVFWSSQCPCVRRYQSRVDALVSRYPADRVAVIGVSSNADESLNEAVLVAKRRGVQIPILRDDNGEVARAVDARSTPMVVVIDQRGTIRYRGWIDNERLPGDAGREAWLERAIEGVLQQRDDFASRSAVYGCSITRSLFASNSKPCCQQTQPEK